MTSTSTTARDTNRRHAAVGSYTSQRDGWTSLVREALGLMRAHGTGVSMHVAESIAHLRRVEGLVTQYTGVRLQGLRMLDVGAGQRLVQMTYFAAQGNDPVGVDRDVIAKGYDVADYYRMWRLNGGRRVAKTVGRKLLGIDARYRRALQRQLGASVVHRRLEVHRMDAADLRFGDGCFDVVYSLTVFQYIADPAAALREMVRVTRPGGVVFFQFLPFTGVLGSFDVGTLTDQDSDIPPWSHLRAKYASRVHEAAFLNRIRISDWRGMVNEAMPGGNFLETSPGREELSALARDLHAQGELLDYDVDELVTNEIVVVWRKPA